MSKLLAVRQAIRTVLVESGLWTEPEIIINRRTKIWNDVAMAVQASDHGHCLVIGTAKGDPDPQRKPYSRLTMMEVAVPVTLIELPQVDPVGTEEDLLWEQTIELLQGNDLGRDGKQDLRFDGFDDLEDDEGRYVMRQTLFRTRVIFNPGV